MKLHILLFATVLASLAALSSCKEEKQPSSPGGSDGNSLVIAENGKSSFKIVYPQTLSLHVTNFVRDIERATGASLSKETIRKDNASAHEIIVGQSPLRTESDKVLDGIDHGFLIKVRGGKVVIAGTDPAWTVLALEYFAGKLAGNAAYCSNGTFKLPLDYAYTDNEKDPQLIARLLGEGRRFDLAPVEVGKCPVQAGLNVAQGAASDGEYIYFCMKGGEESSTHNSNVAVFKYSLDPFQFVAMSKIFNGHHANDMTFDTRNNRALVIHGSGGAKLITAIDASMKGEPELITTDLGIGGITYNAKRNIYGITQGGSKFQTADAGFKMIDDFGRDDGMKSAYTAQGMGSDDSYVYFPMSPNSNSPEKVNILVTYTWDGKYVGNLKIPLTLESESMFYANGEYYVNFYNNGAVLYRVYPDLQYKLQNK